LIDGFQHVWPINHQNGPIKHNPTSRKSKEPAEDTTKFVCAPVELAGGAPVELAGGAAVGRPVPPPGVLSPARKGERIEALIS
jgi:hypothetical protein